MKSTSCLTSTFLTIGLIISTSGTTNASTVVDLEPPASCCVGETYQGGWEGGVSTARSFLFDAVSPFELMSVGIELNLSQTLTLEASLYEVTGMDTVGSLIVSNQVSFMDQGRAWYDIPLSYTFTGNDQRYVMLIRSLSSSPDEATFWSFEGRGDHSKPIDPPYLAGPVRVIDGASTVSGSTLGANYVIAHFRMGVDEIPEPSTLALFGLGSVMLGRRRVR